MNKIVNNITSIGCSLQGKEGYAVTLTALNTVSLLTNAYQEPYGIVVKGCDSVTPGVYPSAIVDGSLELATQVGDIVMVRNSPNGGFCFNDWVGVTCAGDNNVTDSQMTALSAFPFGTRIWGVALNNAASNEFGMMRFQPSFAYHKLEE